MTTTMNNLFSDQTPKSQSTPERQKSTQGNSLKGILINTNSIKSIEKATQLKATIHYSNPDKIFLVETKLDSNYQTYSFLPPNYEAIRKDRNAHGGGVLIAFRDDITAESLDNLNSNCEIVWTKIHFARTTNQYSLHPTTDPLATIWHHSKLFKHPSQNYTDHKKHA